MQNYSSEQQSVILIEELCELIHEITKKLRNPDRSMESIKMEVAHVYISLYVYCDIYGIEVTELNAYLQDKINEYSERL